MPSGKTFGRGSLITPAAAAVALLADISSKQWARANLHEGLSSEFIPGFLHFNLTSNTGAAFSLGNQNSTLMTTLAFTMTCVLIAWWAKRELTELKVAQLDRIGLGLLIGGAMGNLLDRFVRGRVTDFLDFSFISFPVFNTADALIDVGIGLLVIAAFSSADKKTKSATEPTESAAAEQSADQTP